MNYKLEVKRITNRILQSLKSVITHRIDTFEESASC